MREENETRFGNATESDRIVLYPVGKESPAVRIEKQKERTDGNTLRRC